MISYSCVGTEVSSGAPRERAKCVMTDSDDGRRFRRRLFARSRQRCPVAGGRGHLPASALCTSRVTRRGAVLGEQLPANPTECSRETHASQEVFPSAPPRSPGADQELLYQGMPEFLNLPALVRRPRSESRLRLARFLLLQRSVIEKPLYTGHHRLPARGTDSVSAQSTGPSSGRG